MEVENVLLALEEKDKWVRRRERLQKRLDKVRKKKEMFARFLDDVKRQVRRYDNIVTSLKETRGPQDTPTASPLR
jgi:nitrogen fixation/metabolism regulation signal transduction histidine kinase